MWSKSERMRMFYLAAGTLPVQWPAPPPTNCRGQVQDTAIRSLYHVRRRWPTCMHLLLHKLVLSGCGEGMSCAHPQPIWYADTLVTATGAAPVLNTWMDELTSL